MKLTNFWKRIWILLLAASGMCLAACSSLLPVPPVATPTPAPTETPTATIVWFPPTSTPTELPTQPAAPTVEYRPGVGGMIFFDSFDDPTFWSTASSNLASAAVARNRLVLTVTEQGVSIISLRSLLAVDDFYAEAVADLSLCRGKDQYGMLFRAAPGENYYRFDINCNGQVQLERGRNGSTTAIQAWLSSGDAPPGGPAQVKLGVWASGNEMRLFLNDNYQFSVQDRYFHTGTLGFFASSGGTTSVVVSFSNLAVYSVSYVPPPPTPLPSRTPRP